MKKLIPKLSQYDFKDSQQMNTENLDDWIYVANPLKEEPVVTATRKYFVRYDDDGNPIYSTDYSLSQQAINDSRGISEDEKRRRKLAAERYTTPKGHIGEYAGFGQNLALMGAGAVAVPWIAAPLISDAIAAPVSTATGFVAGELGTLADKKLDITKQINDNNWLSVKLPEGIVGGLVGGFTGGLAGGQFSRLPKYLRLQKTYTGVPHRQLKNNGVEVIDSKGNSVYMDNTFLQNKNNITIWTSDSPEYAANGTWAEHSGNSVFDVYTDPKELHLLKTPDVGEGKMVNWQLLPYNKNKGSIQMAEHIITKPVSGIQKDRITSLTKRMSNGSYNPSDAGKYIFKDGEEYVINAKDYGAGLSTDDVVQYSKDMGYDGTVFNRVYDGGVDINGDYYDFPINELVLNPGAPSYAMPHGTSKLKIWNKLPAKNSRMTSLILPTITNLNYK